MHYKTFKIVYITTIFWSKLILTFTFCLKYLANFYHRFFYLSVKKNNTTTHRLIKTKFFYPKKTFIGNGNYNSLKEEAPNLKAYKTSAKCRLINLSFTSHKVFFNKLE